MESCAVDEGNSLKLQHGNRYNDEPVFSNLRLTQAGESRLFASYGIKCSAGFPWDGGLLRILERCLAIHSWKW